MPTLGIFEYFQIHQKVEESALERNIFQVMNDVFRNTLSSATWLLYVTAALLVATCLFHWYFEKRRILTRTIPKIQKVVDSKPPKRRPGAVAREHEVFRNILRTAHSFIYPKEDNKAYVLRQTRSGTVYGKFLDDRLPKLNSKNKS